MKVASVPGSPQNKAKTEVHNSSSPFSLSHTYLIMNGSNSGSELQSSGTILPAGAILRLHSNPVAMVTTCLLDLCPRPLDPCSDLLRLPLVGADEGVGEVKMEVKAGGSVAALGAAWLAL